MNVMDAIISRRSVREYSSRAIAEDVLARCRKAIRSAPSACNFQPWRFVIVTDEGVRRELVSRAYKKDWMTDAPVIVAACGLPDQAYKNMGGSGNSVDVDVAIAMDHLTLAAVAEGLGTCWIGAFDEAAAKDVLGVPENARVIALTPLGYPAKEGLNHPLDESRRKNESDIFSENRY